MPRNNRTGRGCFVGSRFVKTATIGAIRIKDGLVQNASFDKAQSGPGHGCAADNANGRVAILRIGASKRKNRAFEEHAQTVKGFCVLVNNSFDGSAKPRSGAT